MEADDVADLGRKPGGECGAGQAMGAPERCNEVRLTP